MEGERGKQKLKLPSLIPFYELTPRERTAIGAHVARTKLMRLAPSRLRTQQATGLEPTDEIEQMRERLGWQNSL